MRKVLVIIALVAATAGSAYAQRVKDFVEVEGARSNFIMGEGLVVGLAGTGDSSKSITADRVRALLQQHAGWDIRQAELSTKNIALVTVTTELPPFQAEGTTIDVRVSAIGDAKSLNGGTLLITPLRSPRVKDEDPTVFALASGQLLLEGEQRTSVQTSAYIPNGAIVEQGLVHDFIKAYQDGTRYIRLHLIKTDFSIANDLADAINVSEKFGMSQQEAVDMEFAKVVDGGAIDIKIPTKIQAHETEDFLRDTGKFISRVLDVNVHAVSVDRSLVIINDKTKVISVTGDVMVKKGQARKGMQNFKVPNDMLLDKLMDDNGPKLSAQEMVDMVKALNQAGLIKGIVISR